MSQFEVAKTLLVIKSDRILRLLNVPRPTSRISPAARSVNMTKVFVRITVVLELIF